MLRIIKDLFIFPKKQEQIKMLAHAGAIRRGKNIDRSGFFKRVINSFYEV